MTTVTVLALDSSLAMDEVVRQLGENAYILSTTHRDGQVEICATNEPASGTKPSGKPKVEVASFQSMLEKNAGENPAVKLVTASDSAVPGPNADAPTETALIQTAAEKLTEVLGLLNQALPQSAPQLSAFERMGFLPEIVQRYNPRGLAGQDGDRHILRALSRAVIDAAPMALLEAQTILVLGPSGGGKTVLAGKLAALLRETYPKRTIMLATLSAGQPLVPAPLAAYARVLGVKHEASQADAFDLTTDDDAANCRIIEVNLEGDALDHLLSRLQAYGAAKQLQCVLALPTGSSAERVAATLEKLRDTEAKIALCKLDECELSPQEISAIVKSDMQIAWLSGTRSLTGNLAPATFEMMSEFLEQLVLGQA